MLQVSHDAAFLNSVIEHPAVKKWVLWDQETVDLTPIVEAQGNVFLANKFGGFLFIKDGDLYEVHTQFVPEGRGKKALAAARYAADYMFTKTDALAIRTFVPRGNIAARTLTERVGFSKWGQVDINGKEADYYMLTLKEWAKGLELCL